MAIQVRSRVPSAAANGKHGHTLISDEKFRQLYALTLQTALLAQRMKGTIPGGGEAVLAGVAADLRANDLVVLDAGRGDVSALPADFPGRRIAATAFATSFEDRLAEALSAAVAARMKKTGAISVIFAGDEAAEPLLGEAHTMAARAKLPVLFVERGGATKGVAPASRPANQDDGWMPAIPVDAQDVIAIYRVAHESIARAREGSGPARLRCVQWDVPASGPRALRATASDPVEHLEHWLVARGLPAEEWRRAIIAQMDKTAFSANRSSKQNTASAVADGRSETAARPPQTLA